MELKTIKEFAHRNNLGEGLKFENGLFQVNLDNEFNTIATSLNQLNTKVNQINEQLGTVYKVKGSTTVDNINSMTVGNAMIGYVYNLLDSGVITNGIKGELEVVKGSNIVYTEEGWDEFSASLDLNRCAGDAINIESNVVNVKVAPENNFLEINAQNELVVDDVTTNKTFTNEDITIEGGPLATDAVKKAFNNGKISAGTDIQAVLKALLCKEIYPVPTKNTPDYTVSITAPSVTASSVNNNTLVEVGQKITFNSVTATNVTVNKTQPIVSGFTYGYTDTMGGTVVNNSSISGAWTINQKTDNVYELSATISGFTGTKPTTVQNADNTQCKLASCELTATLGTNTYTVTENAPVFVGSYTGVNTKYVVSNLGGTSEEHKSVNISASTSNIEKDPENKSTIFTVTGVYPIYVNGIAASTNDAEGAAMSNLENPVSGDGTKLSLVNSGTEFAVSFANQSLEPYKIFIQKDQTIKSAKAIDPTARTYTTDCTNDFKMNGTTTRKVQNVDITYNIYQWAATEGPNRVKFILN